MSNSVIRERYFDSSDGLRLFYRDYAGPDSTALPVVCLPGLTRNSRDFASLAGRLSKDRRVLSPDLRGRGLSERDPNWRNYHPGTYVEDCWLMLEAAGVSKVIIVGTSLGGLMAMVMAASRPQAIAGIVLNDVGPELAPEDIERIKQYVGLLPPVTNWEEARDQTRALYGQALPDLSQADWLGYARKGFREIQAGIPELDMDPAIGTAARKLEGNNAPDLWPVFNALAGTEVLALRGEFSDILSAKTFARMQEVLPAMRAVIVENRGHAPTLDEAACVDAIDRFLNDIG